MNKSVLRAMPCQVDNFGFCAKCTGESKQIPHLNTRFQNPSSDSTSSASDETITEFTLCTYNVGFDVDVTKLLQFLKEEKPDIVCLQEMMSRDVGQLISRLRRSEWSRFTDCGRSPDSRSIILSIFPLEEVSRGLLPKARNNNQFVTVKVAGLYLTCLHLSAKDEEARMNQLQGLASKVVWDGGRRHIWAGDFNSLTEGDKDKDGWEEVAEEREASNREGEGTRGFKRLEKPKFEVTKYMADFFSDCWATAEEKGHKDLKETCK